MILDATAGNRTIWTCKNPKDIIFIDMERRLEIPPTLFCDNEHTPFRDNTFHAIFYDPPHTWGVYNRTWSLPNRRLQREAFPKLKRFDPYYGWDKYATRQQLVRHIYNAQIEFKRILKPDGILLFKWGQMSISIQRALSIFSNWLELMRIQIGSIQAIMGGRKAYWVVLQQKREKVAQQPLLQFL